MPGGLGNSSQFQRTPLKKVRRGGRPFDFFTPFHLLTWRKWMRAWQGGVDSSCLRGGEPRGTRSKIKEKERVPRGPIHTNELRSTTRRERKVRIRISFFSTTVFLNSQFSTSFVSNPPLAPISIRTRSYFLVLGKMNPPFWQ
jgi:hypothetical protein